MEEYITVSPDDREIIVANYAEATRSLEEVVSIDLEPTFADRTMLRQVTDLVYEKQIRGSLNTNTLFLFDRYRETNDISITFPNEARVQPLISSTDYKSRHGAFFANLVLDGEDRSQDLLVAIRPHIDKTKVGLEDLMKNRLVNNMNIPNTEHIGIQIDEEGNSYVLSVLNKNLKPIDALDWSDFASDPKSNPEQMRIVGEYGQCLAEAHCKGAVHADAYPRNVMTDMLGKVSLLDWETLQVFDLRDYSELGQFTAALVAEHDSVIVGLTEQRDYEFAPGVGAFNPDFDLPQWIATYHSLFLGNYISEFREGMSFLPQKIVSNLITQIVDSSLSMLNRQHELSRIRLED